MERKFIRVHNKLVHIDAISFVEFLDSGRAMIIAHGLQGEKQHIQVDEGEAVRLREILEPMSHNLAGAPWQPVAGPQFVPMRRFSNDR
jgi:hypothetical protein